MAQDPTVSPAEVVHRRWNSWWSKRLRLLPVRFLGIEVIEREHDRLEDRMLYAIARMESGGAVLAKWDIECASRRSFA